jgi:acetyltransferase-like isoleucine patch superfamily enzyme
MGIEEWKKYSSHGDGKFYIEQFENIGFNIIFESGVLVFHPENISISDNVYIGHNTILKGYYKNKIRIGKNTWIGQGCFIHGAGGVRIGNSVGIGPMVKIITSNHSDSVDLDIPIMSNELVFNEVVIEDNCDIGVNTTILPGVKIGKGSIIGAGSVVTKDVPVFTIAAGVPARIIRTRGMK